MALRTPAFNDARSYGFEWLRVLAELGLKEGVIAAGDFKVTAAAAGGMRVDVAAGTALVKGDSGVAAAGLTQGLFVLVNDASIANAVTLNASDATNPRVDQIVLKVRDSADLGSGANDAILEVLTGTPTGGATLDNRSGAAALGNDRIRLADVLVPAASAAVTAGNVRDRRPWARGASRTVVRTSNAGGTDDYATASSTFASVDATNLSPRMESSGLPIEVQVHGIVFDSTGPVTPSLRVLVDGVSMGEQDQRMIDANTVHSGAVYSMLTTPAAGSRKFDLQWQRGGAGTLFIQADAARPMALTVRELVGQNASND